MDAKEVAVNITDHDSNFLPLALPTSITLAPQSLTTRFEISTIDDEVFESDGQITASIQSGTGYEVSTILPG